MVRDRFPDSHQRMLQSDLETGREEAEENETEPREEAFSEGGVDLVSAGLETFSKIGMKGKTMCQVIVTDNLVKNTVPA